VGCPEHQTAAGARAWAESFLATVDRAREVQAKEGRAYPVTETEEANRQWLLVQRRQIAQLEEQLGD
jgi:hypothetical protein